MVGSNSSKKLQMTGSDDEVVFALSSLSSSWLVDGDLDSKVYKFLALFSSSSFGLLVDGG